MINKLLAIFSLLSIIVGGLIVYSNTAYFPKASGAELEQRVNSIENSTNMKLDMVINLLQKKDNK